MARWPEWVPSTFRHQTMVHMISSGANPLYASWECVCLDCHFWVGSDPWRDSKGVGHRLTMEGVSKLGRRHEADPEWFPPSRGEGCLLPSECVWCGWETKRT